MMLPKSSSNKMVDGNITSVKMAIVFFAALSFNKLLLITHTLSESKIHRFLDRKWTEKSFLRKSTSNTTKYINMRGMSGPK